MSIAFSIDNPAGVDRAPRGTARPCRRSASRVSQRSGLDGLFMTNPQAAEDDPLAGSFALCLLGAGDGKVSYLRGWPQAKWWASPLLFWDDFSTDGELGPEPGERNIGWLAVPAARDRAGRRGRVHLRAGLAFPESHAGAGAAGRRRGRREYRHRQPLLPRVSRCLGRGRITPPANLPSLEKRMREFLTAMRETTLPAAVKEAAMANLSTLVTPTCFRTADGKFRGFEGINDASGCCHGNCTHVWNYETTTQHLFPTLARSMREGGVRTCRIRSSTASCRFASTLPEGQQTGGTPPPTARWARSSRRTSTGSSPATTSGCGKMWPKVKKAMEFAWVQGGWDGDRDGVMEGVQHNTYDVEFYGPNPMCGIYYLGALRACEEMARAMAERPFAEDCRRLFESGSKWIDANLFNGEYYIQKIRGIPADKIAKPLRSSGGRGETPSIPISSSAKAAWPTSSIGQYLARRGRPRSAARSG